MIKVDNLYKSFDEDSHPLKGASFEIKQSEFVLIMGRSGCGKSTLLNCICGIEVADSGDIYIDNKKVDLSNTTKANKIRKKDIGIVFQQYYLLTHTSVYNQIALICDASEDDINEILKALEIYDLKNKMIENCSGGQQQRVCIARALAKKPKIIFADEPTANLDASLALVSLKLMRDIAKKLGSALLIISHDDRIVPYADRVFLLADGKISQKNTKEPS
jgi:putative ABC transport system ATP-binding protein